MKIYENTKQTLRTIFFRKVFASQVKLRGFRVELSEIEQVLVQRTSFQATVLVCGETLVAFLVADHVEVKHVKEEVGKVLPYYMVPQVIISSSDQKYE